jgi:HAD superfamily hydrolase (TIGR01509 family)
MTLSIALQNARGILFDMDGVLIDSEPVHEKAIVALTEELGTRVDDHAFLFSLKGIPEKIVAEKIKGLFPESDHSIEHLIGRKIDIYAEIFEAVELIPGAKEFVIQSKAAGKQLAVATSASRSTQELTFAKFGFDEYFEAVVAGDQITHGKPHPEPYLLAASKLGLPPADCIVIEDSINGVISGKAAGCQVIGLTTTFPRETLLEAGAHFIIDTFAELDS